MKKGQMEYKITGRDTNGEKDWTFTPSETDDLTDFILYEYRDVLDDYTYDIEPNSIVVKCKDEIAIFYYERR